MKLALGTVQFGLDYGIANRTGKITTESGKRILDLAATAGLDTLDTAIAYGESERTLGQIGVQDWSVVSKLPPIPPEVTEVAAWVRGQVKTSLARLGLNQMHALLLHRPEQLLGDHGRALIDVLEQIRAEGLVSSVGVSVYCPEELEPLFEVMHFDIVQAPLSILDQRMVASGWTRRLRSLGVELHTRSVFLQGLLLMPMAARPEKFARWAGLWKQWDGWLAASGLTALEACLRYALSIEEVDRVIVGVDGLVQLTEILSAADGPAAAWPRWDHDVDPRLINPSLWNHL
jgi:aryl-alcohol dehydrogenase-like predicted oxidoreductase